VFPKGTPDRSPRADSIKKCDAGKFPNRTHPNPYLKAYEPKKFRIENRQRRRHKITVMGKLDFGRWEQIFYGEFAGRRKKPVLVKIIGE